MTRSQQEERSPKPLGIVEAPLQLTEELCADLRVRMAKVRGLASGDIAKSLRLRSVRFLSDGATIVRNLQRAMHPNAEHILDWFHVAMRLTVLKQYVRGIVRVEKDAGDYGGGALPCFTANLCSLGSCGDDSRPR